MDFLNLAQNRYSCRSFKNKPVEQEKLDLILEAGRVSPTARNLQPQRILVITDEEKLSKLSECTKYGWNAPVIMVICYDKNSVYHRQCDNMDFGFIDSSIVTTQMMLEIQNLGLGTTWIGAFDPQKQKKFTIFLIIMKLLHYYLLDTQVMKHIQALYMKIENQLKKLCFIMNFSKKIHIFL